MQTDSQTVSREPRVSLTGSAMRPDPHENARKAEIPTRARPRARNPRIGERMHMPCLQRVLKGGLWPVSPHPPGGCRTAEGVAGLCCVGSASADAFSRINETR